MHTTASIDDLFSTPAELVETHGFQNRWTAKVYQWCLEAANYGDVVLPDATYDDCGITGQYVSEAARVLEDFVTKRKRVHWSRLHGVDFLHIAVVMAL